MDSSEAADGEEFTNKIPDIVEGWDANPKNQQMCLIHREFKHFGAPNTKQFRHFRNVSSIMCAKVLSIMLPESGRVTSP